MKLSQRHSLAALSTGLLAFAATATAAFAQASNFRLPALLISEGGAQKQAWIVEANRSSIRYASSATDTGIKAEKASDYKSIYFLEPTALLDAKELYAARKYDDAKAKFAAIKEFCKPVEKLENNPGAIAAFYEMQCMRALGDLEGLAKANEAFDKDTLINTAQVRQLEVNSLWATVARKDWQGALKLAQSLEKKEIPADQIAQVSYCKALALESLDKPEDALIAYNTAIIADASGSEYSAKNAFQHALGIYAADQAVQRAMEAWGNSKENKNAAGRGKLLQAGALANLYEATFGAAAPLPAKLKIFAKYTEPKTKME